MKFRLISKHADAIALLYRIWKDGDDVSFWVKDKAAKTSYKNMPSISQVENWNSRLGKDTIILFDMVGLGPIADSLKKAKFKVYGGGKLNDRLELDRQFGMKVARVAGLKIPQWEQFGSFDKAKKFVASSGKAWVFKPQNNKAPAYTYVSEDAEDMSEMLDYFKDIWTGPVDFILQEKINGLEVSTECWYVDGQRIPGSLNSTIEQKRFMDGDKGQNTGCQSSIVWFWKKVEPRIYKYTLRKIEPFLRRFKYNGPLDVNCIISEKDKLPYFLEFTARFGYSAIYALCEGLNIEVGKFLADLAAGQTPKLKPSYDWLGAVRVSIPPYPADKGTQDSAGRPIRGVGDTEHIWLLDAKYEKNRLLTAGVDGVVCEVTAKNSSLDGLGKDIYGRIKKLKIPDKQYREDAIKEASNKIDTLREWRYF